MILCQDDTLGAEPHEAEFRAVPDGRSGYPYETGPDGRLALCRRHLEYVARGPFDVEGITPRAVEAVAKWRAGR